MTLSAQVVSRLIENRFTIAVAESLTGGMLVSRLIDTPGASATVVGGVVAYNTDVKRTMLGVDEATLNVYGPVHPDVALQMASRVRDVLAVGGVPADVGVATTGVAGPDPQDGHPPGTVYIGVSVEGDARVTALQLEGDRDSIRRQVVDAALETLLARLE